MKHTGNFRITCMYDTEIGFEKMSNTTKLDNVLNKNLKITDYTEKFKKLFFVFVAKDGGIPVKDSGTYQWKKQMFSIYHNLPYQKLLQATKTETIQMFSSIYLTSIETYFSKRKDIDHKKLYEDVKRVFVEKLNLNLLDL